MIKHLKLIITYYALICPLNILRRPTRFSQKARGSFDAGYPEQHPGPHTVYVYKLTWYDIAGDGGSLSNGITGSLCRHNKSRPVNKLLGIYPGSTRVFSGSLNIYMCVSAVL